MDQGKWVLYFHVKSAPNQSTVVNPIIAKDSKDADSDRDCLARYAEGDESCLCQFLDEQRITTLAENEVCYRSEETGADVYVNDVCPGNGNKDVCWLNGCGDIVMHMIKDRIAPTLGLIAVLMIFAYCYGVVYTVQLTIAVSLCFL